MLKAAKRRRFDVLVCWRLDRLKRNLRHLILLLDELQALGIAFVTLGEGLDTSTPAGRLRLHILSAIAEFERSRIQERVVATGTVGAVSKRMERMLGNGVRADIAKESRDLRQTRTASWGAAPPPRMGSFGLGIQLAETPPDAFKYWRKKMMMRILKTVSLAAFLTAAPLIVACDRPANEPDFEARVNDQLKTANLDNKVNVDWKADEKALHLTGEVERAADKTRAEELAAQVVGTSGRVVNELKVEGEEYARIDDRIEEQLNKMFEDRTEWDFDGRGVSFDAEQGVVTITGTVESAATKEKIGERTRALDGVKDVVNNLDVDPKRKIDNRRY